MKIMFLFACLEIGFIIFRYGNWNSLLNIYQSEVNPTSSHVTECNRQQLKAVQSGDLKRKRVVTDSCREIRLCWNSLHFEKKRTCSFTGNLFQKQKMMGILDRLGSICGGRNRINIPCQWSFTKGRKVRKQVRINLQGRGRIETQDGIPVMG